MPAPAGGDDWLEEFARETRTAVLERVASAGSCILSTRVGLEVLRFFGIPARPVPVRIVAHGTGSDPWCIGIAGTGRMGPETWDGHLVLSLPTQQWLVDLSLDQMSRVQRGLELGPAVAETPPGWGAVGDVVAGYCGQVLVAWQVIAGRGYTRCPDWSARRAGVVRDAAADAITRLRGRA